MQLTAKTTEKKDSYHYSMPVTFLKESVRVTSGFINPRATEKYENSAEAGSTFVFVNKTECTQIICSFLCSVI